ncbi:MAG: diguanylate cyclase, partial [Glaciecola sp.]|nr:diguanylate cyclase [Glaciecola sp.]
MILRISRLDLSEIIDSSHDFSGLSISIGIAMEYPQINKTPEQLFERADDAKFQAKRSGLTKLIL